MGPCCAVPWVYALDIQVCDWPSRRANNLLQSAYVTSATSIYKDCMINKALTKPQLTSSSQNLSALEASRFPFMTLFPAVDPFSRYWRPQVRLQLERTEWKTNVMSACHVWYKLAWTVFYLSNWPCGSILWRGSLSRMGKQFWEWIQHDMMNELHSRLTCKHMW